MPNHFWRDNVVQFALNRDVEATVAEQKAILERDPTHAPAYFSLGTLSHFTGQVEQAVQYFEKAIVMDSNYAAPHVSLGRIYVVRGDYERAWRHARAAEQNGDRSLVDLLERYACSSQQATDQQR